MDMPQKMGAEKRQVWRLGIGSGISLPALSTSALRFKRL